MKFKCNGDGVYVEGERFLFIGGISRERMELAELQLWDYGQEKSSKVLPRMTNEVGGNCTHSPDIFYTSQLKKDFYHLGPNLAAEVMVDKSCASCGKKMEVAVIDLTFDVIVCDECVGGFY